MWVIRDDRGLSPYAEYIRSVSFIFKTDTAVETTSKDKARKFATIRQANDYIKKYHLTGVIEKA